MGRESRPSERRQKVLNLTLAGVAAQVGCLTLIIILGAVLGGLWLDARFQTRPLLTILLVLGSIPLSLVLMFVVVRAATSRIQKNLQDPQEQEAGIGKTG